MNIRLLKKVQKVISFNQEAWLKEYTDMKAKLRTEAQTDFYNLMNNSVFGKTIENARKHRDIKLLTTDKKEINQYQNLITIQQNTFQKTYLQLK